MKRLVAAAAAAAPLLLLAFTVIPAGAGNGPLQSVEVRKEIVGPVPPGAEFEVRVQCVGNSGVSVDQALTFTEPGSQIVDTNLVSLACVVAETQSAGASVTYACEPVLVTSTCTSDNTFTNSSDEAQTIVTITNTFAEPPPPPPPPEPLEVSPTFTG